MMQPDLFTAPLDTPEQRDDYGKEVGRVMTLAVAQAVTGRELGRQGMRQTLDAEGERWHDDAIAALKRFGAQPVWREFKAEDFRAWWLVNGGRQPHSHHCWGALTNKAEKLGVLAFTGRFGPSVSPKTRGHYVRIWRLA